MIFQSFVLAAVVGLDGPYFPAERILDQPRADVRRCTIGRSATTSDCALIHERWVVTRAGSVAAARTVNGTIRVRIGDDEFAVEQLVYHPEWKGGARHDVTLLKLTERVRAFPLLPPPGEFPRHHEHIVANAFPERGWVAQVTGGSPLWHDGHACPFSGATRAATILGRVRELIDGFGAERDGG